MKKRLVLAALSAVFLTGVALSQIREIPKVVEETFTNQYKGASNIDFKDQLVRVDVYFDLEGEKMIASYTNKGLWKETQKESADKRHSIKWFYFILTSLVALGLALNIIIQWLSK